TGPLQRDARLRRSFVLEPGGHGPRRARAGTAPDRVHCGRRAAQGASTGWRVPADGRCRRRPRGRVEWRAVIGSLGGSAVFNVEYAVGCMFDLERAGVVQRAMAEAGRAEELYRATMARMSAPI